MCWCEEPTLDDLMDEQVIQAVMRRDQVEEAGLRRLIDEARRRLSDPAAAPSGPAN